MFTNRARNEAVTNKKFRHYIHSPFSVGEEKIKVEVDKQGRTTISEGGIKISCPAAMLNNLSKMIKIIGDKKFSIEVDGSGATIFLDHADDSSDEIRLSADLINKAWTILLTTRSVELKDEPFKGDEEEE